MARVSAAGRSSSGLTTGFACLDTSRVASLSLVRRKPLVRRWDLLPWALPYAVVGQWVVADASATSYRVYALLAVAICHALTFLAQVWSVRVHRWLQFDVVESSEAGLQLADSVMVEPVEHGGRAAIVALTRRARSGAVGLPVRASGAAPAALMTASSDALAAASSPGPADAVDAFPTFLTSSWLRFEYQSCVYELVKGPDGALAFDRLDSPDHMPLGTYVAWHGWATDAECAAAVGKWGPNEMHIPVPQFGPLFYEHALAPFFVFQVLCVVLWMLDEYWYYSLFTLAMLCGMEALMVLQRITQATSLRKMRPTLPPVHVFRQGVWYVQPASNVLPGDIISLSATTNTASATAAPAGAPATAAAAASSGGVVVGDCLLLRGTVVVNEAMLTGESAPLLKEAISLSQAAGAGHAPRSTADADTDAGTRCNAFASHGSRSHVRHAVFAGTSILQAGGGGADSDDGIGAGGSGLDAIPPPPDGGAVAVVVRTAFQTSQGELMRTISHVATRASAANWEAFVFIAVLLVFALAASYHVLVHGWDDPNRSRYKLVLHCIMICTSVVPPELPIELSLAVNASITTLVRRGIFCTEPFRIVLGGKVDVACFDKTGTLTGDEFAVTGLVLVDERAPGAGPSSSNGTRTPPRRGAAAATPTVSNGGGGGGTAADPAHPLPRLVQPGDASLPADTVFVIAGCHSLVPVWSVPPPPAPPRPALPFMRAPPPPPATVPTAPVKQLVGDPMEKAAITAIGWSLDTDKGGPAANAEYVIRPAPAAPGAAAATGAAPASVPAAPPSSYRGVTLRILKRWAFSSEHKRMTTVVAVENSMSGAAQPLTFRVLCKGAPEALWPLLQSHLRDSPAFAALYHEAYAALTCTGARVLALVSRQLRVASLHEWGAAYAPTLGSVAGSTGAVNTSFVRRLCRTLPRGVAEADFSFCGFLVLASPLKTDTVRTVRELQQSLHRVVMITGDAPMTALAVARQTGIVRPPTAASAATVAPAPRGVGADDADKFAWVLEYAPAAAAKPESEDAAPGSTPLPASSVADGSDGGAATPAPHDVTFLRWQRSLRWAKVPLPSAQEDSVTSLGDAPTPATSAASDDEPSAALRAAASASFRSVEAVVRSLRGHAALGVAAVASWKPTHAPFVWDADALPAKGAVVCVTGAALSWVRRALLQGLVAPAVAADVQRWAVYRSRVFARMSPDDKQAVVVAINTAHAGAEDGAAITTGITRPARHPHFTLMCGDGTNDVAALKQCHVGVSILSNPVLERKYDVMRLKERETRRSAAVKAAEDKLAMARRFGMDEASVARMRTQLMAQAEAADAAREASRLRSRAAARAGGVADDELDEDDDELAALLASERAPSAAATGGAGAGGAGADSAGAGAAATTSAVAATSLTPAEQQQAELKARLESLQSELMSGGFGDDAGMVGLGDASIASPFTSRFPSPLACVEILRQGRCTLLATQQVYRILAVNSLVLSYMLSALYLHGVKTGDTQATASGLAVTAFFMMTSWAKPLKRLAPQRPHTSVFNWPLVLGVAGQFIIHLTVMMTAVALCTPFFEAPATAVAAAASSAAGAVGELAGSAAASVVSAATATASAVVTAAATALPAPIAPAMPAYVDEFGSGVAVTPLIDTGSEFVAAALAAAPKASVSLFDSLYHAVMGGDGEVEPVVEVAPIVDPIAEAEKFRPNVINTVVFILSLAQQAVTFLVNYTGYPYMQPLSKNKPLLLAVAMAYGFCLLAASGASLDLTAYFEFVQLPETDGFKSRIIGLLLLDGGACIALELLLRSVFGRGRTIVELGEDEVAQ